MRFPLFAVMVAAAIVGLMIFLLTLGKFVDESTAIRALEKQGYSNIEVVDKDIWFVSLRGCGDEDVAKFDAVATNPAGKEVDVFVCIGWPFKGATVRTN